MTAPWTIGRKLGQIKLAVVGVTLTNFNGVRRRLLQLGGEESSSVQPAFVHVCGTMGGNRPVFTYLIFKRTISGNEIKKVSLLVLLFLLQLISPKPPESVARRLLCLCSHDTSVCAACPRRLIRVTDTGSKSLRKSRADLNGFH